MLSRQAVGPCFVSCLQLLSPPCTAEPGWHFMYELFKVLKVMTVIETVCVYVSLICAASSGTVWSRGSVSS
jgi:hypothetical protein